MKIIRTNSSHEDFKNLVAKLDAELAVRDGAMHGFYHQFNNIESVHQVVLLYVDTQVLACGALKNYQNHSMELKRMFVHPEHRGKGFATRVLQELELWAKELDIEEIILETGINQPEAIALYTKKGYTQIDNYGQYAGVPSSVCFLKKI